jgi:hypothetical protein
MAPYRIDLHDETGRVCEVHADLFAHDDHAIDHAGSLAHPHEINVWQGKRHVARFPPVVPGLLSES